VKWARCPSGYPVAMSHEFAQILRGLLANRQLSPRVVSRASGRAESTINQLLTGRVAPNVELLQDIAPALQMPLADLLVIAGIPEAPIPDRPGPYRATEQIGELVAVASFLTPQQVNQVPSRPRQSL
jgi:transcriptional regulator with XRE-family HTH domain